MEAESWRSLRTSRGPLMAAMTVVGLTVAEAMAAVGWQWQRNFLRRICISVCACV